MADVRAARARVMVGLVIPHRRPPASADPELQGTSGQIINATGDLAPNTWNAGLNLLTARAFMGSSVQSAFAFFLGGQTPNNLASDTTELVVW